MDIEIKAIDARRIVFFYLPPIAYMMLIFYMSSQPVHAMLPEIYGVDKVIHVMEYGMLGILWIRALKARGVNIGRIAIIAFAITFLYGISDEIHQYFVPERSCDVFDAMVDGAGGWLGIWVYRRLF